MVPSYLILIIIIIISLLLLASIAIKVIPSLFGCTSRQEVVAPKGELSPKDGPDQMFDM